MAKTAKKVTETNHLPGTGDARFPVYSKQFNELVEVVQEMEPSDGNLIADTISEQTEGNGVQVDGVSLKDGACAATAGVTSSSPTAPIGYASGSGGVVTQLTSITTGVTINKVTGSITTVSSTLAAGADATFTVTNSAVGTRDIIIVNVINYAGTADGIPVANITAVASGSFDINIRNTGAVALDAVISLAFAVIKGQTN